MIKKLQALRAKKGFTLVELIVVIAIIGVLAAILVPTMLGMVTKANVTSANTTAAEIQKNINSFLTDADTAGYGMLQSSKKVDAADIIVNNGVWTMTALVADNFKKTSTISWGTAVTATTNITSDYAASTATKGEELLLASLAKAFPDMKNASIYFVLVGDRNCAFVAYTNSIGGTAAAPATALTATKEYPTIVTTKSSASADGVFAIPSVFAWDTKTAGISSNGYTVGTAPALALGTATTSSTTP